MSNLNGPLIVSMNKVTIRTKILINPVSSAEDMIPNLFLSNQLHLDALVVLEKRWILTRGYKTL